MNKQLLAKLEALEKTNDAEPIHIYFSTVDGTGAVIDTEFYCSIINGNTVTTEPANVSDDKKILLNG